MTQIGRAKFTRRLTELEASIPVAGRGAEALRSAGVADETFERIAGDDHVIRGEVEYRALYDAISRENGGRVDARVADRLFAALERQGGDLSGSRREQLGVDRTRDRAATGIFGAAASLPASTPEDAPSDVERFFEAIAEFFVELFTGDDFVTHDEQLDRVGMEMAARHPETLRAALGAPGGREALRARLHAQRPAGFSPPEWSAASARIEASLVAALETAPRVPPGIAESLPLELRDQLAAIQARPNGAEAVRTLGPLVDSGLDPAVASAMVEGTLASDDPAATATDLADLTGRRGFGRVSTETQAELATQVAASALRAETTRTALRRLEAAHTGELAGLNDVLFGDATLSAGDEGPEVRAAQRYLRALGYDGIMGQAETTRFTRGEESLEAAVTTFQRATGLLEGEAPPAREGVLDRATLGALTDAVQARGLDPTGYRFTTELSLDRPPASDRGWRVTTERWTPERQAELSAFLTAYVEARIPRAPDPDDPARPRERPPEWHERVDCADLAYEGLIVFARQRELPIWFGSAARSHRGGPGLTDRVQNELGAAHIRQFTTAVPPGDFRPGDMGNMDWDQAVGDSYSSRYNHVHNVVAFEPLFREATVVYGSLDDVVRQSAIDRFDPSDRFSLTLHDIPEVEIIDAIHDDSGAGRGVGRPTQERRVRALLERHARPRVEVTDADVDRFISMIRNPRNIRRNAPTAVRANAHAFSRLVDPSSVDVDAGAARAAAADVNQRFGTSITEAQVSELGRLGSRQRVEARVDALVGGVPSDRRAAARAALLDGARGALRYDHIRDTVADPASLRAVNDDFNRRFSEGGARVRVSDRDVRQVLRAGTEATALRAARDIVERRGVPEAQRDTAARALVDAVDATRSFRRWDFSAFNRHR